MSFGLEQIRGKRLSELAIQLDEARAKSINLKEVFVKFRDRFYKEVETNWEYRGTLMGKRWVKLSPKYAKWKRKKVGNAQANLILTGRLKKAATGKSEDSIKEITNKYLNLGIKNIPYARVHQWGFQAIPQRPYFLMKQGGINARLIKFFQEQLVEHLGLEKK